MQTIGVVGLGLMGQAMATNLLAHGHAVRGYDVRGEAREALAAAGGSAAASAREAGEGADAVVLMVFSPEQVEDVLFGADGLAGGMKPGAAVIVTASVGVEVMERVAPRLEALGLLLVDCPVRASSEGAAGGEMYLMVSGAPEAVDTVMPLLGQMGNTVVRVGERPGMAQVAKTCMQAFFSLTFQTTFEVLALGAAAGLDPALVYEILNSTGAASGLFRSTAKHVAGRVFTGTNNPLAILDKDAHIASALAKRHGLETPAIDATARSFAKGMDIAPDEDIWAGIKPLEQSAGVEVRFDFPGE